MSKIFGGSKSQSKSYNQAYDWSQNAYAPLAAESTAGMADYNDFLSGNTAKYDEYKKATGFQGLFDQGSNSILARLSKQGLLDSGAAGKALVDYGNDMQNEYAQTYLDRLLGRVNTGFNAGQLITGAGNYNESSSKTTGGIGGLLGTGLSTAAGGFGGGLKKSKLI